MSNTSDVVPLRTDFPPEAVEHMSLETLRLVAGRLEAEIAALSSAAEAECRRGKALAAEVAVLAHRTYGSVPANL